MSTGAPTPEDVSQRRAALRALLRKPLLTQDQDSETVTLVRRHQQHLQDWLTRETGWRLHVDPEAVRLFQPAGDASDPTRPARGHNKEAFGRRRYVVLCLALAALERGDAQTTLGALAEEVLQLAAEPELLAAGIQFTLEHRAERSDLVAVVRMLLHWGVLVRVAGDEDAYLSATGDVLYDVRRPVLGSLLTATRGPSTIGAESFEQRITELTAEPVPDTDEVRNQQLRRRLTRRLLLDPVVYYQDLDPAERDYLQSQRSAITRRIQEETGLVPEIRAEGVAMVDPSDELTDVRMPEQHTDGHVTLLIAEYLADRERATLEELHGFVREAAARHATYWRKGVTEPGAEQHLVASSLDRLAALRLVDVGSGEAGQVRTRPALGRFAVEAPTIRSSGEEEK